MCADGSNPSQGSEEVTSQATPTTPSDQEKSSGGWARRKFLTAAALGTAAAAFLKSEGGARIGLGPLAAYADDLSGLNCTANDVRIVGPGIILNEPCDCPTGTKFPAKVAFRVINNTGTTRYCVTVHFCPVTLPGGGTFSPDNIVIGDIPPKSDGTYDVTIPGYPCGAGKVCFGACGPGVDPVTGQSDCSFPKGTACPTGECCTTITWDVNPGCPTKVISSKCRHQQVCIQGFGITAECADGSCAARSLTGPCCSVSCGQSLNVKITATGSSAPACPGSLTLSVKRPGASSTFMPVTLNASGCYVDSSPVQGTYTFRATDCHLCYREAALAVCVNALSKPDISVGSPDCSGNVTVTIDTGCPQTGVTFTLQTSSACDGTFTDSTATFSNCATSITLTKGATTCLRVKASNGQEACDQLSNCVCVAVPAPLSIAATVLSTNPCTGAATFTRGAVTGGTGSYTFAFKLDAGSFVAVTGDTFVYGPMITASALDTGCHSVVVRVSDSNGCTATSPATTFSQCISTTTGCTP